MVWFNLLNFELGTWLSTVLTGTQNRNDDMLYAKST
jgi:hypothetical protein